jgi:hypothetical protein
VSPTVARASSQATFAIMGASAPVVVTAPRRTAPAGTLTLDAATFEARDTLLGLLDDGSPLLLRAPGDYGLGYGLWLSLGDLSEDPGGRPMWSQGRTLSAPFQAVDSPAGPNLAVD